MINLKIKDRFNIKKKISLKKRWFSSINYPKNNTLIFLSDENTRNIKKLKLVKNSIILIRKKIKIDKSNTQIITKDPKLEFFKTLKKFYKLNIKYNKPKIGHNVKVHENVFFGKNVVIGDNSVIMPNVVINDNVKIGKNCLIKSSTVIGQKGFQAIYDKSKKLISVFHVGGVSINNFVEIGALNTIACGAIDNTVIDDYTKIDDHVHVAHNIYLGTNNIICAGTIFGGSVSVGNKNFFGLNSTIRTSIKIGNNNIIGQSTNLVKDIGNNNIVYGNPGKIK
jgi:UDP-3-O-[3-hydroxymyristoyl] glucosamine N-acyltransferase